MSPAHAGPTHARRGGFALGRPSRRRLAGIASAFGLGLAAVLAPPRTAQGNPQYDSQNNAQNNSQNNAQKGDRPTDLERGEGIATSMFGTYIRPGELLVYPFFEYYTNRDEEYDPEELGYELAQDFRGKFRASEGLLFIGYGISDRWAIEIEAAVISATLEKSPEDPSETPERIEESGTGDVEGQLRYRWAFEGARRPEVFSYLEVVSPQQQDKKLIGTADWEFKLGVGVAKQLAPGTFTLKLAAEYDAAEETTEIGECAIEYLRRLSPTWRAYLGVEGTQDEWEMIPELQWRASAHATVKLNSAFGLTSKATDWAPEVGVLFSFPRGDR